jgi:hypothetical protein
MAIVESKSVTSKVKINPDGSWERIWDNHWQGMPSPVNQAQRQAAFLRNYLNTNKEKLLKKILGFQQSFKKMPIDIVVAISDSGRIDRSKHSDNSYVFKADQAASRIRKIYEDLKKKDTRANCKSQNQRR